VGGGFFVFFIFFGFCGQLKLDKQMTPSIQKEVRKDEKIFILSALKTLL
jgi:hypothetical protein